MDTSLTDIKGRAYGREEPESDPVLVHVGPGTPGGELLRRYWQPIALSSEATDLPNLIRRFGEDLILFRNLDGKPGLVYPRCMHRGTTLLYGKVEADGIRCCYHGWKFGNDGQCLDQPAEPYNDRNRNREMLRQPWYPVVEEFGAIWTYMGPPEKQPLFPIFSCFENLSNDEYVIAHNSLTSYFPNPEEHNWFQRFDNVTDHFHIAQLHSLISGDQFPDPRLTGSIPLDVSWRLSDDKASAMVIAKRTLPNGDEWTVIDQAVMPNVMALAPYFGEEGLTRALGIFIPWDDTRFSTITFSRQPKGAALGGITGGANGEGVLPRKQWSDLSLEERQRFPGDYEAQNGQGTITRHSEEHLAYSDSGVVMHRRLFREQAEVVRNGGDPVGVAFREEDRRVNIEARAWTVTAAEHEHGRESASV
jgi:phenylpropionate dioxygenase-like ring-hydroxylating dioxygenase large terminal subunit